MLNYACGYIQSGFRGFFTRKGLKKKFKKILTGLVKPKPSMNLDIKGGKGGKGGKPGK
jgi:hypothetical protein